MVLIMLFVVDVTSRSRACLLVYLTGLFTPGILFSSFGGSAIVKGVGRRGVEKRNGVVAGLLGVDVLEGGVLGSGYSGVLRFYF